MIDQKRKLCHHRFQAICEPKVNNCGKCLILLVTVLFIGEGWLNLLKTGLSRQFCSEKLLQIGKNTFQ